MNNSSENHPKSPEYPAPNRTLLHISDTHLVAKTSLYNSSADPKAYLKTLFSYIVSSGIQPDAIIFTGDIADVGDSITYKKVIRIVEPMAKALNTKVIWTMGNHDKRENFSKVLLNEENTTQEPIDQVIWIGGLRIINLDTSVPGYHHGEVTPEQLIWLKKTLKKKAPEGTLIAMHHPPVPSVLRLASVVELRNQKSLETVLKNTDVRGIIAGHLHYSSFSTFAGIPVSVATSTCYTQDLKTELGSTRPQDAAQGFNIVNIYENTILHSVVPLEEGNLVGEFVSKDAVTKILKDFYA